MVNDLTASKKRLHMKSVPAKVDYTIYTISLALVVGFFT